MKKPNYIVAFPIRYSFWISLAFVFLIILSYLFFDRPIALFFNHRSVTLEKIGAVISLCIDPDINVFLWPTIFYIIYFLMKQDSVGKKALFITIAISVTNIAAVIIKAFFGRYRPELWFSENLYGFSFFAFEHAEFSFPSGHATTISAIVFALSCLYRRYFVLFLCVGFFLSFARILVEKHFLSDILAGMLLSFILTQLIYISMEQKAFSYKT